MGTYEGHLISLSACSSWGGWQRDTILWEGRKMKKGRGQRKNNPHRERNRVVWKSSAEWQPIIRAAVGRNGGITERMIQDNCGNENRTPQFLLSNASFSLTVSWLTTWNENGHQLFISDESWETRRESGGDVRSRSLCDNTELNTGSTWWKWAERKKKRKSVAEWAADAPPLPSSSHQSNPLCWIKWFFFVVEIVSCLFATTLQKKKCVHEDFKA